MGGHVNMMDDVLITNLSSEQLRSAMRTLVSLGRENQQTLVKHVRGNLIATEGQEKDPRELFPAPDVVSKQCSQYLARSRCTFVCHLPLQALRRISNFCNALIAANASWSAGSDLEAALEGFGGDIVQSVQALKESGVAPTDELQTDLQNLTGALESVRKYCQAHEPTSLSYPLTRAKRQVHDVYSFLFPSSPVMNGIHHDQPQIKIQAQDTSKIEKMQLGSLEFPRLFNGLWQLSSPAWGSATAEKQEAALKELVEAGLYATDMADHYGDAELVYGEFRNKLEPEHQNKVYAATKWCVFRPVSAEITEAWVLQNVEARCRRLGGRVELLQFHWYNYEVSGWLFILEHLVRLTKTRPDLVTSIGLCNFDAQRTAEACEHLVKTTGSVGIVSNQVQFSLLDSRPLQQVCRVSEKYGLKLLTYGSLSGGLISEKWAGQPTPEPYSESTKMTPSQRKYYDMILSWGSWTDFQELLARLAKVGAKYNVSVTVVASRWVLQQPAVGAVIVGTRLGVSAHGNENLKVFDFVLDAEDLAFIDEAALGSDMSKSKALYNKLGDCGHEYRALH